MDTITHGIAGALIGKAVFRGEDLLVSGPPGRSRLITWSLMVGAVFPDADVIRDLFSHNQLLMITWHRSITHSLLMLPVWAVLLALLTGLLAKSRGWEAPGFRTLTLVYTAGLLSHILLDLVTTFGTMIWSPVGWSRPAWDLVFIVDFTCTAIFLLPQLLAWVYSGPLPRRRRALGMVVVFLPVPFLVARMGDSVGAPISDAVVFGATLLLSGLFLLPALRGWGFKVRHEQWNRAGLFGALLYLGLTAYAHQVALSRIRKFAALEQLPAQSIGALPLPPSLWHWDGLVRTDRGVYELRMDLSGKPPSDQELVSQEHRYYPEAWPNRFIETAKNLPEVQKVLWFARFPVTRFHKEGAEAVVEIADLRFARARPGRPPSFTYRVRFGADGTIVEQGWATR